LTTRLVSHNTWQACQSWIKTFKIGIIFWAGRFENNSESFKQENKSVMLQDCPKIIIIIRILAFHFIYRGKVETKSPIIDN